MEPQTSWTLCEVHGEIFIKSDFLIMSAQGGNIVDQYSLTRELIAAIHAGAIDRVREILDLGVAVNCRDIFQWTPLIIASNYDRSKVVALLLDRGADVDAVSTSGSSALLQASSHGHLDVVHILVARGANIHLRNRGGSSSLVVAAMHERLPVCEYLLSVGADLAAISHDNPSRR